LVHSQSFDDGLTSIPWEKEIKKKKKEEKFLEADSFAQFDFVKGRMSS
jgi:hypothetical protein